MAWSPKSKLGADHTRMRKQVLAEEPMCQACHVRLATECDHIVPRYKGGSSQRSNLQGLCRPCHAEKTARESAEAKGHRYRPRCRTGADGWPV